MIYVLGIRLSTILMGLAILGFGFYRRRPIQAALAAFVWIEGFEFVWEWTAHLTHSYRFAWPVNTWQFILGLATATTVALLVNRVSVVWLLVAIGLGAAWLATGFDYNIPEQPTPINWGAEILNEGTKLAWGMVWLWTFLRPASVQPGSSDRKDAVDKWPPALRPIHAVWQSARANR